MTYLYGKDPNRNDVSVHITEYKTEMGHMICEVCDTRLSFRSYNISRMSHFAHTE